MQQRESAAEGEGRALARDDEDEETVEEEGPSCEGCLVLLEQAILSRLAARQYFNAPPFFYSTLLWYRVPTTLESLYCL